MSGLGNLLGHTFPHTLKARDIVGYKTNLVLMICIDIMGLPLQNLEERFDFRLGSLA